PFLEDSKACAAPWKLVVIVPGNTLRAVWFTWVTASPSATPGFRLNESVTAGSCPRWLIDIGPSDFVILATVESGTIPDPVDGFEELDELSSPELTGFCAWVAPIERTYSIDSADGSIWNCGCNSMITR